MIKSPKGIWHRPWSPGALDNQSIARLVNRPYMVMGFQNYGRQAFDDARKVRMLNAATAPTWFKSPYGPAMRFLTGNNYVYAPTPGPGTTYPTTFLGAAPLSVAVLYRVADVSGQTVTCSLAVSGGMVRLTNDFGGTQWVASGVGGYAAFLGYALADWILGLFSIDAASVSHQRFLNLTTGAVATGDDTGITPSDANTDIPGVSVGGCSFRDGFPEIAGFAYVKGAWTQSEMATICQDPTGIWRQRSRARSYKASGATPVAQTFTCATENLKGIATSRASSSENLLGIATSRASSSENLLGIAAAKASTSENLKGLSLSLAKPTENLGSVALSLTKSTENLQAIARTVAPWTEALQGGSLSVVLPSENLGGLARSVVTPTENLGTLKTTKTSSSENLQGVAGSRAVPTENMGPAALTRAFVAQTENLGSVVSSRSSATENLSTFAVSRGATTENLSALRRTWTLPTEVAPVPSVILVPMNIRLTLRPLHGMRLTMLPRES